MNKLLVWATMVSVIGSSWAAGAPQQTATSRDSKVKNIEPQAQEKSEPQSSITNQEFPQEKIETLIIKGKSLTVKIKGSEDKKFSVSTQGRIFRSRNGKFLIIDGHNQSAIICELRIPNTVNTRVSGGRVDLLVEGVKSNLDIEAGDLVFRAAGPLQNVKGSAGKAVVDLDGIQKDLIFSCGHGDIRVNYDLAPYLQDKKAKGLTFSRPPMASLRIAFGKAKLSFPKEAKVFYRKKIPGLHASHVPPAYKDFDVKLLVYTPPESVQIEIEHRKAPNAP